VSDTEIETEPLTLDKGDEHREAAGSVVEELRDFLSMHHLELTRPEMTLGAHGFHGEMPLAADDPQYAARIHRYKNGRDAFINVMRDNY
jgi:hypothetical protein